MLFNRRVIIAYFLALLLIGVGYISIQPIFEGFDENAHYSSIRQIAGTGVIPIYGDSYLDQVTTDYQGPVAYGSGEPPFDSQLVYYKFFADKNLVDNYIKQYRNSTFNTKYHKSNQQNWQAQHPPLYYAITGLVLRLINGYSFVSQFFILRLFSYFLALIGVLFGINAVRQLSTSAEKESAMTGFLVYPVALPMFFPEFARLGNDSMCVMLVGILAWQISLLLNSRYKSINSFLVGVTIGIGFLVKALFLPILVGVVSFITLRIWKNNKESGIFKKYHLLVILLIPVFVIGGSWYLYQYLVVGHITSSADTSTLASQGGFLVNWKMHFSAAKLISGLLMPFVTYVWAGSWSLARLNVLFYVPLLGLLAWLVFSVAAQLKKYSVTNQLWLPVYVGVFFMLGLFAHVIICIASLGIGNTPGWYLHILMPWVAPLLGVGVMPILHNSFSRLFFMLLILYAILFQLVAIWSQLSLYAGCAVKGINKYYQYVGGNFCLDQWQLIWAHMGVTGWPLIGLVSFTIGFVIYVALLVRLLVR